MYLCLIFTEFLFDFGIKNNVNIKQSFEQKTKIKYDGVIHGPCEPLFSVDPQLIEHLTHLKLLNIAQRHTDFADNFLQLYLYLNQHPETKYVFLYVTPESFDVRYNTFHSYRYAPYLNDTLVKEVVSKQDPKFAQWLFLPMMKYSYYNYYKNAEALQGFKHWVQNDTLPYFKKGYIKHATIQNFNGYTVPQNLIFHNFVPQTQLENQQIYFDLYKTNEVFRWDVNRENYLIKIINLCKSKAVRLVLFESPVYKMSIKNIQNRNSILNKINKIALEYKVEFWTFEHLKMNKNQQNFVSPLILSRYGTEAFMPVFSDSILTLIRKK